MTDLDVLTALRFFPRTGHRHFCAKCVGDRGRSLSRTARRCAGHLHGLDAIRCIARAIHRRLSDLCVGILPLPSSRPAYSAASPLPFSIACTSHRLPRVFKRRGWPRLLAEMWKGFRVVAKNRKVLITSSTDAAKMIANGALMAFLPLYGVSAGLNPGEVGLLFTVQALTSLVSKPIMGRVSDSVGRQPLIVIGLVICAATFVCIPQVSIFWLLLLLSAGFGFGEAVVSSSSSALVADSSEFKTLGAGMGMQGTIGDIGHASGPLVAGILIAHLNYANAFAIIAGLQLVAAAVFWMTMRRT